MTPAAQGTREQLSVPYAAKPAARQGIRPAVQDLLSVAKWTALERAAPQSGPAGWGGRADSSADLWRG